MSLQPKIAVVILNWNGKNYLEKFLPPLISSSYNNFEIIVVDNCSTDDSISFLRQTYPNIRIIQFEVNYGFAKGYNKALKQIESDYYAILNSDVEVQIRWLEPMVELLEKNPSIAACQPKILSYTNRNVFEYAGAAGGWLDKYGYPFAKGRVFDVCEEDKGQYDQTEPIFMRSAGLMNTFLLTRKRSIYAGVYN